MGPIGVPELLVILYMGIMTVLYFVPTLVARRRQKRSTLSIFLLNFFLGWTVFGWIAALVWAVVKEPSRLCHRCGKYSASEAQFCGSCGQALLDESAQVTKQRMLRDEQQREIQEKVAVIEGRQSDAAQAGRQRHHEEVKDFEQRIEAEARDKRLQADALRKRLSEEE